MTHRITIELSERDLKHFRRELRRARASVSSADDEEILSAASDLVAKFRTTDLPDFVAKRLVQLETLVEMLLDADWNLGSRERAPVLAALAYVCDPEDIIPDDLPGIGLLDDAVMIELVFMELTHEIEAYADYKAYRKSLPRLRTGRRDPASRAAQLARRREQLIERMRRRRARAAR